MVNCLRKEFGGDKIRCILDASLDKSDRLSQITPEIFARIVACDLVMNIYRNNSFGSFRHLAATKGYFSLLFLNENQSTIIYFVICQPII